MKERILRTVVNVVGGVLLVLLPVGAWECTAAPKAECGNGDVKVVHKNGKATHYTCHNNEWIKDPHRD